MSFFHVLPLRSCIVFDGSRLHKKDLSGSDPYAKCQRVESHEVAKSALKRGETMTKAELVEMFAGKTGVSKKDTGIVVNLILENIGQAMVAGGKVELRGFGSFKVKNRRARLARNPRTGEAVQVPSKQVPYFKASNELKSKMNATTQDVEATTGI